MPEELLRVTPDQHIAQSSRETYKQFVILQRSVSVVIWAASQLKVFRFESRWINTSKHILQLAFTAVQHMETTVDYSKSQ